MISRLPHIKCTDFQIPARKQPGSVGEDEYCLVEPSPLTENDQTPYDLTGVANNGKTQQSQQRRDPTNQGEQRPIFAEEAASKRRRATCNCDYSQVRPSTEQLSGCKGRVRKYSKINQQKKFQLLSYVFRDQVSIREAATLVGINHLTAKTIVFFYKNNSKAYKFEIGKDSLPRSQKLIAAYRSIRASAKDDCLKQKPKIEIVCSVGNILSTPTYRKTTQEEIRESHCDVTNSLRTLPFSLGVQICSQTSEKCSTIAENSFSAVPTNSPELDRSSPESMADSQLQLIKITSQQSK